MGDQPNLPVVGVIRLPEYALTERLGYFSGYCPCGFSVLDKRRPGDVDSAMAEHMNRAHLEAVTGTSSDEVSFIPANPLYSRVSEPSDGGGNRNEPHCWEPDEHGICWCGRPNRTGLHDVWNAANPIPEPSDG